MAAHNHDGLSQENGPVTVPQPQYDPYFTANENVIQDLLFDEKRYHTTPGYCIKQPLPVAKWMRRALLNWLRDVCQHRQTDSGVLAQTAQLIDRYLHVMRTDRREYQLVGSACLFIASKLKETIPVTVDDLVKYTDYSVTQSDIIWDLSCITPVDFIAPVVDFLEFVPSLKQVIRHAALSIHVKTFHVENLCMYLPSYLAAACILYALNLTVHPDLSDVALRSVTRIQQLLRLEARKIREVYQHLQICFEPGTVELSEFVILGDKQPVQCPQEPINHNSLVSYPSYASVVATGTCSTNQSVIVPLATSTQLQSRRSNNTSESTSLSSAGSGCGTYIESRRSIQNSYEPPSHQMSCSASTSSPSIELDGTYPNDVENEQPTIPLRHSMPYSYYYSNQHQPLYPNVHAAGHTLLHQSLPIQTATSTNGFYLNESVDPPRKTSDLLAVKANIYPSDNRFLILSATTATTQYGTQRRWTPTDIREVQFE